MALNTPPTLLGVSGRMGEPERTEEHTRGTRARGRRRQARCQCRRTEPEALKFVGIYVGNGAALESFRPSVRGSCAQSSSWLGAPEAVANQTSLPVF